MNKRKQRSIKASFNLSVLLAVVSVSHSDMDTTVFVGLYEKLIYKLKGGSIL